MKVTCMKTKIKRLKVTMDNRNIPNNYFFEQFCKSNKKRHCKAWKHCVYADDETNEIFRSVKSIKQNRNVQKKTISRLFGDAV